MSGLSTAPANGEHAFRPDIEGLRAVAVLLVLGYHAGLPGVTGGFVGVDVFFVISGFLITGLIVSEVGRTGTVALGSFYARRARRLLPAAALVIVVTLIAAVVILPPLLLPDVAADGAATAIYAGNIRFAIGATDYLQAEYAPSPLLHYWSLGVEEQFYLVWPALLLVTAKLRPARPPFVAVIATVAVASFIGSVWLTGRDAPLAFFLLPTRAWELALGGLVWLAAARLMGMSDRVATLAATAGLGAIVVAALVLSPATPFPGTAALIPTVGAALVLAAGVRMPQVLPSRVVALSPLRWIGRISYSLYLWHWPLVVLPATAIGEPLPLLARVGLILLAFPLAAISERFVERPFREGRLTRRRPGRTLALAGATSLVLVVVSAGAGLAAWDLGPRSGAVAAATEADAAAPVLNLPSLDPSASPAPSRSPSGSRARPPGPTPTPAPSVRPATAPGPVPANLVPPLRDARADVPPIYRDGCHASAADVVSRDCVYGDPKSKTTVILFGDSHAAQWFPAFERLAEERGWRLVSLTKSACPVADVALWSGTLARPYDECSDWLAASLDRMAAEHPALVVVANSRDVSLAIDGQSVPSSERESVWREGLERSLEQIGEVAQRVVILGDTPNPVKDPPACLSAHLDDALACTTPASDALAPAREATERAVAGQTGATFIETSAWVCPTDPCPAVIGRLLVYRDSSHISTPLARALAPYIGELLPTLRR